MSSSYQELPGQGRSFDLELADLENLTQEELEHLSLFEDAAENLRAEIESEYFNDGDLHLQEEVWSFVGASEALRDHLHRTDRRIGELEDSLRSARDQSDEFEEMAERQSTERREAEEEASRVQEEYEELEAEKNELEEEKNELEEEIERLKELLSTDQPASGGAA